MKSSGRDVLSVGRGGVRGWEDLVVEGLGEELDSDGVDSRVEFV